MDDKVIVFTRYPEPGTTKTRLIPALGPEGAAELQRKMTEHTVDLARQLQRESRVSVEIHFDGGDARAMEKWLGGALSYFTQGRGDMGVRMCRSFCRAFGKRVRRAVLVGADCPGLTVRILKRAFEGLGRKDLVLGPAEDGGYYLIGLVRAVPQLFVDIPWSTDQVLTKTIQVAQGLALTVELLDTLRDMDRVEDLSLVERVV